LLWASKRVLVEEGTCPCLLTCKNDRDMELFGKEEFNKFGKEKEGICLLCLQVILFMCVCVCVCADLD